MHRTRACKRTRGVEREAIGGSLLEGLDQELVRHVDERPAGASRTGARPINPVDTSALDQTLADARKVHVQVVANIGDSKPHARAVLIDGNAPRFFADHGTPGIRQNAGLPTRLPQSASPSTLSAGSAWSWP